MNAKKFIYSDSVVFYYRGNSHSGKVMGQLGKEYVYVLVPNLELVVTVHPGRIDSEGTFSDWEEKLPLSRVRQHPSPKDIWSEGDHLADQKKKIIDRIKLWALVTKPN